MRLKKSLNLMVFSLLLVLVISTVAFADCTDIVISKGASEDGSVITSHTVDGRYDSRIQIIPAQEFEEGAMAPVYENIVYADRMELEKLGEIPQVEKTYKYFHGAYPYANEKQVIIGETTLGGARETKNSDEAIMTIEQLEIFALQRADTAREAVQIMGRLAEEYGYRESCWLGECLTVTDPNEAWVFEIFGVGPLWTKDSGKPGAVWAAKRVPDGHVTVVPNYSRIRKIEENSDDMMYSENYKDTAIELGLYDPEEDGEFIWNKVYGGVADSTSNRLWRFYNLMQPSKNWEFENTMNYPFSIKPEEKVSVQEVIAMFRDTQAGTKHDMTEAEGWYYEDDGEKVKSPLATPQVNRDWRNLLDIDYYRPIARYYCSYYFVSQARDWLPDEVGGVIWFGLDNPENSPFIPMYVGVESVPKSWSTLNRDKLDRDSAWWAFALVDDTVNRRYGDLKPELDKVLNPMQEHMYEMQGIVEQKAFDYLMDGRNEKAKEYLTNYTSSLMNAAEKRYWELSDEFLYELNNNRH
jgi:dipeptidase